MRLAASERVNVPQSIQFYVKWMESVAWNSDTTTTRNTDCRPVSWQLVRAARKGIHFTFSRLMWSECGVERRDRGTVGQTTTQWPAAMRHQLRCHESGQEPWELHDQWVRVLLDWLPFVTKFDLAMMVLCRGFTLALSWHPHYYPAPVRRERETAPCPMFTVTILPSTVTALGSANWE